MRDLAVLFLHLLATVARLAGPGGARSRGGRIRARQAASADPQSLPETFTQPSPFRSHGRRFVCTCA